MPNCSSRLNLSAFRSCHSSRALFFNLFGLIFILSLCCGVGLVMFAKYYACDPLQLGLIKQTDQVCLQWSDHESESEYLSSCIHYLSWKPWNDSKDYPGSFLLVSSVVHWGERRRWGQTCTARSSPLPFSTLSSGLNSLAAVVLSDIIKFFYRKEMTDKQDVWYSKMLCKSRRAQLSRLSRILRLFSIGLRRGLYSDHIPGFTTWQSSSSCSVSLRCALWTYQCYFHDRIFPPLDQFNGTHSCLNQWYHSVSHLGRTGWFNRQCTGTNLDLLWCTSSS